MGYYVINGQNRLFGETDIQGSKNSALAILMACIITTGETVISNLPSISDVKLCLKILRYLGCEISYLDENTVKINTKHAENTQLPITLTSGMRASSYLIGALTSRFGECTIPQSGGCDFGSRPIDMHLSALCALGAKIDGNILKAENGLKSAKIIFPKKTGGGTVNAIIAACLASGITIIENAAREPHIKDLCDFLNKCGAEITGGGNDTVRIRGRKILHGCQHTVDSDMIETGTFVCACIASGGKIRCTNAPIHELTSFFDAIRRIGASIQLDSASVTVTSSKLLATDIITTPYPGFPTDLHPQTAAILGISNGKSKITETVFSKRFGYLKELKKFGLEYLESADSVVIHGTNTYYPASVTATDLRGGAAAVICALNASGSSTVSNIELIERGYSRFSDRLNELGADIQKNSDHLPL